MAGYELRKDLKPWHEAIVDWQLANPTGTLEDCATHFGKSYGWLCTLMQTDAFKQYKALRFKAHQERVSETIISRTQGLAEDALDAMRHRIQQERDNISLGFLHDTAELTLAALGYGPKAQAKADPHVVTLNFNSAPRDVLEEARADMRRLHQSNTRDVSEAEVVDAPKSLTQDVLSKAET